MMAAASSPPHKPSLLARLVLTLYTYLPMPFYAALWAACSASVGGKSGLEWRLAIRSLPPRGRRAVWFHAASVGEISTIAPVVTQMKQTFPDLPVVVTTMTPGGARRAAEKLEGVEIALAPYDFLPAVKRFVAATEPACLVIGETELWPNMITEAKRQGASVVLVNGRISQKSYPRYRTIRFVMGWILNHFDLLLMRTETDAHRIVSLGAAPERVEVAGNTKYDMLPAPIPPGRRRDLRRDLGISERAAVVTLGSAREGESEIVMRGLAERVKRDDLVLVIAPRHLNLVPQIEQAAKSFGRKVTVVRGLDLPAGETPSEVIILAQMGHLLETYAISDVAIVGGTLRPFGGHNPLEPASQGVVTVVGPFTQNIRDDMSYLTSRSCALAVDEFTLGQAVADILADEEKRQAMGRAAARAVEDKKGIAQRCVDAMVRRGLLPRE
ncbi:MAG TPA: glycosyltransferase N-terminal domain-containing protein [bacterium]|nr:glycosyltransferase N-terminal domain-containing protein [bacterium]